MVSPHHDMVPQFVLCGFVFFHSCPTRRMNHVFCADELCELKEENPIRSQTLKVKERRSLEEKEETVGGGEKGQQEEEEENSKEEEQEGGAKDEEEELEELRAQVVQLLLELEEMREDSQRHEENFMELQGEELQNQRFHLTEGEALNLNVLFVVSVQVCWRRSDWPALIRPRASPDRSRTCKVLISTAGEPVYI